jgi:hypothetical protein
MDSGAAVAAFFRSFVFTGFFSAVGVFLFFWIVSLLSEQPKPDVPKYKQGQKVYVVAGPFKGREAIVGVYAGGGVYTVSRLLASDDDGERIGALKESDLVDTELVSVKTGEVAWSEK